MTTNDATEKTTQRCVPRRREDLHVEELDDEAVVYDPRDGSVHRFNDTMFFVWNACQGTHTLKEIASAAARQYAIHQDAALEIVGRAVVQLCEKGLLQNPCVDFAGIGSTYTENKAIPAAAQSAERRTITDELKGSLTRAESTRAHRAGPSRREVLGGGATRLVFAVPVISTFFARGAYASGPSASAAFGVDAEGACKTVLYSCAVNADCCEDLAKTACEANDPGPGNHCCIQPGEPCDFDEQCCGNKACEGGTCNIL